MFLSAQRTLLLLDLLFAWRWRLEQRRRFKAGRSLLHEQDDPHPVNKGQEAQTIEQKIYIYCKDFHYSDDILPIVLEKDKKKSLIKAQPSFYRIENIAIRISKREKKKTRQCFYCGIICICISIFVRIKTVNVCECVCVCRSVQPSRCVCQSVCVCRCATCMWVYVSTSSESLEKTTSNLVTRICDVGNSTINVLSLYSSDPGPAVLLHT